MSCLDLDLLRRGVDGIARLGRDFLHKIGAWLQIVEIDLAGSVGGVLSEQCAVAVHFKGGIRERLHGLSVILENAQMGLGAVGDHNAGIARGCGVVDVHIDAVLSRVEDISGGRDGFLHGVVALRDAGDIGKAVVIGGDGGHKLTVPIDLKAGSGETAEVVRITLIDLKRGLPHIPEGQGDVGFPIPIDRLNAFVQRVALRR